MRRAGWYKESYRHALAARGISTSKYLSKKKRYYQNEIVDVKEVVPDITPPSSSERSKLFDFQKKKEESGKSVPATSIERELSAQERIEKKRAEAEIKSRPYERALDSINNDGNPGEVLQFLATGKDSTGKRLTSDQLDTLQTSLNAYAMKMASSKNVVPDGVLEKLDKNIKKRVEAIEEENRREFENPLRKELREDVAAGAIGAVDLAVKTPGALGKVGKAAIGEAAALSMASGQVSSNPKDLPGIVDNINELEDTPPFEPGTNVFIDDKGMFGNFDVPRTSQSFQFEPLTGGGTNIALAGNSNIAMQGDNIAFDSENKGPKSYAEAVQKKVDSLSNAKADLAKVDLSSFEKGQQSFEEGDREGLISSISELQSQEAKLKDRWNLLAQTHAQMQSVQNHESAFKEDGGSNFFFGAGSGARKLADQTEKLSDVRGEILKANNEAFSRRKMLEYSLQRMDSVVPPETSVPKSVQRFGDEGQLSLFKGVDNVAIKTLRGDSDA